ncbi:bile salt-activated lipase-like [Pieris napi]|uniref:bile salt-activated lipase-like n=1 Tax=Pieris napi TaxID=78633 RepID=UPI001FBA124E|nr:bile salt-activated lipase-like [Pieris napi]XP_047503727.1 bile salt-activated lipase-like [Pieris napi]
MQWKQRVVLWSLVAASLVQQPAPEVRVSGGWVQGIISADGSFYLYTGIPYATATRFRAPGPPPKWEGTLRAVNDIEVCPQVSIVTGSVVGSEDCLKLNVYVPTMTVMRPRAVMVFIHGGAFLVGSGGRFIYGPEFLMKKDVILVTFNYRLGALGFTCLGIEEAPGNAGLKDQIAALKWVRDNIGAFGGDPDNVTVFGESAGATSASLLMASTTASGLFKRAILQSGSGISNWAINREPVRVASLVASKLGFHSEDPHELYEFLSKTDYRDLVPVMHGKPEELFFDTQLLHLPCVEEIIPGEMSVITDLPWNLFINKKNRVPVVYGTNSREGMFLTAEVDGSVEGRNGKYIVASDLSFSSVEEGMRVSRAAQDFYFGSDRISIQRINNITDLYTHLYFEVPSILESELLLNSSSEPVFNYIFDYSGGRNLLKFRTSRSGGGEQGACHGDELFYLFDAAVLPFRLSDADRDMVDFLTSLWSNFAKYGNPTPAKQPSLVRWEPSDTGQLRFLHIGQVSRMGAMPNPSAYRLWRDIYLRYRKTHYKQPSILQPS